MSLPNVGNGGPVDPDPGGSEDTTDWCDNCRSLREKMDKLQIEHELNYTTLKEKIISTDLLIKRYSSKCQEYDQQTARLEETTGRVEQTQRDYEVLETKLKSAYQDLEPVKKANEKLRKKQIQNDSKIEELESRLESQEILHKQYIEAKKAAERECQTAKEKLMELEQSKKKLDAENKKLKGDAEKRLKEMNEMRKKSNLLTPRNKDLQAKVSKYEEILKTHGLWHLRKNHSSTNSIISAASGNFYMDEDKMSDEQDRNSIEEDFLEGSILDHLFREVDMAEQSQNDSGVLTDFFLRPLEPAMSPLPPSPEPLDIESDNESMDEMAEVLESRLLRTSSPQKSSPLTVPISRPDLPPPTKPAPRRRRGRPLKHRLNNNQFMEHMSGYPDKIPKSDDKDSIQSQTVKEEPMAWSLAVKGPLPQVESLSDPESDNEKDLPFTEVKGDLHSLGNDFDEISSDNTDPEEDIENNNKSKIKEPDEDNKDRLSGRKMAVNTSEEGNHEIEYNIILSPRRSPRHRQNLEPGPAVGFQSFDLFGKTSPIPLGPMTRSRRRTSSQGSDSSSESSLTGQSPTKGHVTTRNRAASGGDMGRQKEFKDPKCGSPLGRHKIKSLSLCEEKANIEKNRKDSLDFIKTITRSMSCPEECQGKNLGDSISDDILLSPSKLEKTDTEVEVGSKCSAPGRELESSMETLVVNEKFGKSGKSPGRKRAQSAKNKNIEQMFNLPLRPRTRSQSSCSSDSEVLQGGSNVITAGPKLDANVQLEQTKVHKKSSMYQGFVSGGQLDFGSSSVIEDKPVGLLSDNDSNFKAGSQVTVKCPTKQTFPNSQDESIQKEEIYERESLPLDLVNDSVIFNIDTTKYRNPNTDGKCNLKQDNSENLQGEFIAGGKEVVKKDESSQESRVDSAVISDRKQTGSHIGLHVHKNDIVTEVCGFTGSPAVRTIPDKENKGEVLDCKIPTLAKIESKGFIPGVEESEEVFSVQQDHSDDADSVESIQKTEDCGALLSKSQDGHHKEEINVVGANLNSSGQLFMSDNLHNREDSTSLEVLHVLEGQMELKSEKESELPEHSYAQSRKGSDSYDSHITVPEKNTKKGDVQAVSNMSGTEMGVENIGGKQICDNSRLLESESNSEVTKIGQANADTAVSDFPSTECSVLDESIRVNMPSSQEENLKADQRPDDHEDSGIGGTSDEDIDKGALGRKKGIIRQHAVQVEQKNMLQKQFKLSIDSQSSDILPVQMEEPTPDVDFHHSSVILDSPKIIGTKNVNIAVNIQTQIKESVSGAVGPSQECLGDTESKVDKQESIGFDVHSSMDERDSFSETEKSPVRLSPRAPCRFITGVVHTIGQKDIVTSQDPQKIDAVKRSLGFRPVMRPEPPSSLLLGENSPDMMFKDSPNFGDSFSNTTASTSADQSISPGISETCSDHSCNTTASFESGSVVSSLASSPVEKVDRMTPLSPLSSSDQESPLSPLSLSDLEFEAPISPLPPSPFQLKRPSSRSSIRSRSPADRPVRRSPLVMTDSCSPALVSISSSQSASLPKPTAISRAKTPTERPLSPMCQNKLVVEEIYEDVIPKKSRLARVSEGKPMPVVTRNRSSVSNVFPVSVAPTAKNNSKSLQTRKQTLKKVAARLSGQQPGMKKTSAKKSRTGKKVSKSDQLRPSLPLNDIKGSDEQSSISDPGRPTKRLSTEGTNELHGEAPKKTALEEEVEPVDPVAKAKMFQIRFIDRELQPLVRKSGYADNVCHRMLHSTPPVPQQLLVERLIKVIMSTEVNMLNELHIKCHQSSQKWTPVVAEHEMKAVRLLVLLESKMVGVCQQFLTAAYAVILKKSGVVNSRASVCRVCASLCRQGGQWGQLRVLVYDMVQQKVSGLSVLLAVIVGVWPEILARRTSGDVSPMIEALEFVVLQHLVKKDLSGRMIVLLKTLCRWKVTGETTELAKKWLSKLKMLTSMKSICNSGQVFEFQMAIQLLASSETWEWNNNTLIVDLVWPMLKEWATRTPGSGVTDQLAEVLVSLLGHIGCMCPSELGASLDQLFMTLTALINGIPGTNISFGVQCSSVESMLRLSTFKPDLVAVTCQQWAQRYTAKVVPQQIQSHLQDFVDVYKSKLPYLCTVKYNPG